MSIRRTLLHRPEIVRYPLPFTSVRRTDVYAGPFLLSFSRDGRTAATVDLWIGPLRVTAGFDLREPAVQLEVGLAWDDGLGRQ